MTCIVCHGDRGRLYTGPSPNSTDQFVCRPCQKSPMPQLRAFLERARIAGFPFDRAWPWALERVRWPHPTPERREWKMMLGVIPDPDNAEQQRRTVERIREGWRTAYERTPTTAPTLADAVAV